MTPRPGIAKLGEDNLYGGLGQIDPRANRVQSAKMKRRLRRKLEKQANSLPVTGLPSSDTSSNKQETEK